MSLSLRLVVRESLLLLLTFAIATIVLTWPLAEDLTGQLPLTDFVAKTDALVAGWVLGWESHALATSPGSFAEANIFHPTPHALFYGPTGIGALPLFGPVFWASGNATLALNVTFLAGVALTAWTMSVVVLLWTGSLGAAFVSGWVLLMSRWLLRGMVATAPFAAALMYFPVILYLGARARGRQIFWLVPLVALQCSVDIAYVAPAVMGPLGVIALWRLIRPETRADAIRLTVALVLAVLLLTPLLAGYAAVRAANPFLNQQSVWKTLPFPMPISTYVLAGPGEASLPLLCLVGLGALLLGLEWRRRPSETRPERAGVPPAAAVREMWAHGALWLLIGFVLSLPAAVIVFGATVASPMGWLEWIVPALSVLRTRSRLGVPSLMGFAVLGGAAVAEIQRWLARAPFLDDVAASRVATSQLATTRESSSSESRGRWIKALGPAAVVVLALVLLLASTHSAWREGELVRPFPVFPPPRCWSPGALAVLRAQKGPLLELPIPKGKPNPTAYARTMYRSMEHFRPLLNGHHSYYPKDHPALMDLAARVPDPDALATLQRETGLTTIAVLLDYLLPNARRRWEGYALTPPFGMKLVFRSQDELIFTLTPG